MDSEVPGPVVNDINEAAETSVSGSYPSKKNQRKVPKRVHKSEREKLKREHLNDLFLELAIAIELTQQNNGKASILGEATRLLKDMLAQVECLKRENAALFSESQYVTIEKNELRDETSVLEAQIEKLQSEIEERAAQSKPDLNVAPSEFQQPELASHFLENHLRLSAVEPALQQAPVMGPVFVIPLGPELQAYPEPGSAQLASKPPAHVSKPHARYPTPADSWPSQLLGKQPEARKEFQLSRNSEEQGSGNV